MSPPVVLGLGSIPYGKRAPMVGHFSSTHHSWYRATLTKLLELLAQDASARLAGHGCDRR